MSATDSDDFGRCKWCGNLTDSAGCLNITCAAQSARRDSQVSRICTRCQQAVPDGDLLCRCQVVNDPSADVEVNTNQQPTTKDTTDV
jgi:hypothetical protein